jgi:exosome complex component CSL4
MSASEVVCPGDEIGSSSELIVGTGVYERDGVIRSSLCGKMVFDYDSAGRRRVSVIVKGKKAADFVPVVGDTVLCRVVKSNNNQVFVEILAVGDSVLRCSSKAVIRREDIADKDVDKIVMHERFKGGDIVKASVLSLGDSKQYYLSTIGAGLGVVASQAQ